MSSSLINAVFYRVFVHARKFYATDACVGCGKCEEVRPLKNVRLMDGRPVWKDNCTHCMACICGCPKEAIECGRKSKGQPRYSQDTGVLYRAECPNDNIFVSVESF